MQVSEHLLPEGEGSLPYAMAVDDHDRLWVDRRTREIWFGTDHDTIGRARIP